MNRKFCLISLLVLSGLSSFANENEQIRKQFIEYFTQETLSESSIERQMNAMRPDGTWPDVDYASKRRGGWPTLNHLKHVVTLATAYADPESARFQDPQLKAVVLTALNHWIEQDYRNTNWWQWRIGIPENMLTAFILMGDDLPESMLKDARPILDRSKMGQTGQNKVWCAGIAFMKGLLYDDPKLMDKAVAAIWSELRVSTEEGIQPDWSFHQHGPQQQFGNYGLSFAGDMIKWALILRGTEYELSGEQLSNLRYYMINGVSWIIWNGRMDFSGCGRQIDEGALAAKGRATIRQLELMKTVDPEITETYEDVLTRHGFNPFWRSEMAVQRRPEWYASVKMSSTRVIGAETCNDENMQGVHLGDGTLLVYRDGSEYEDIMPLWDWKRLPGTTCDQGFEKLAPKEADQGLGVSGFSGVIGDGETGVAAMIYKRNRLTARKAWFFNRDAIVCLGAGIEGETEGAVYTSVQQSWLRGTVMTGAGRVDERRWTAHPPGWLHHAGIGYVYLDKTEVSTGAVEGNWLSSFPTRGDRPEKGEVFSMWVNHGKSPKGEKYAYVVFPNVEASNINDVMGSWYEVVLSNTPKVQAVETADKLQAVFYDPGKVVLKNGKVIEVDGACLLSVGNGQLVVADPVHKLDILTVTIDGRKKAIKLPQGSDRGRQVAVSAL